MTHYYFHLENGQTLLDDTGVELRDIAAAQNEALRASSDIFRAGARATATLWNGTPWRMWVTDNPNGEGILHAALLGGDVGAQLASHASGSPLRHSSPRIELERKRALSKTGGRLPTMSANGT